MEEVIELTYKKPESRPKCRHCGCPREKYGYVADKYYEYYHDKCWFCLNYESSDQFVFMG